jgi:L-threonylcarbamoyladenylate synthase
VADKPIVLRPGAVTTAELSALLQCDVHVAASVSEKSAPLLSPGLLAKHYSPRTPVRLLDSLDARDLEDKKVGAIVFSPDKKLPLTPHIRKVLSERGKLDEVATNLFSALRELDSANVDLIVVDTCEPIGLGAAIMDRLLRAAQS